MNRDDIIKMAESCGIPEYENNESQAENIIRFFHMAQAFEREECAKVVENHALGYAEPVWAFIRFKLIDTIRARGQS